MTRSGACLLVLLFGSPAFAEERTAWMSGEDMRSTFAGKRVAGVYPNGVKFEETYAPSGTVDYKDDLQSDTGNWAISAGNFCFFYRSMQGGCFKLHREGKNCYQAVLASEAADSKRGPLSKTGWAVLMWRADMPSTCAPTVSSLDGSYNSNNIRHPGESRDPPIRHSILSFESEFTVGPGFRRDDD